MKWDTLKFYKIIMFKRSGRGWRWCNCTFFVECGYISGCRSNLDLKILCWYIIESLSRLWSHFPNNATKLLQKIFSGPFPVENLYFAHCTALRLTVSRGNCKFYNQGFISNVTNGKMKLIDSYFEDYQKKTKLFHNRCSALLIQITPFYHCLNALLSLSSVCLGSRLNH